MLGLRVCLRVVLEMVRHGDRLRLSIDVKRWKEEYLLRGPEGVGSEGALSLP